MVRDTQDRLTGQLNRPRQVLESHRGVQISGVGNRQRTITWDLQLAHCKQPAMRRVVRRSVTASVHGQNFTQSAKCSAPN